jgi:hypothetical protein
MMVCGVTEMSVIACCLNSRGRRRPIRPFLEPLGRYPVAFGLWKGDLTLKRRLIAVIDDLERQGLARELARRYRIAPIDTTLRFN